MDFVRFAAPWVLLWNWLMFSGLLGWNHLRVRAIRRAHRIPEEQPAIRDPRSMHGLAVEGLSFVVAGVFRQPAGEAGDFWKLASIVFGLAAVTLLFFALRHLGLEWRIKAVVTDDHRLVTTGPYSLLRHPVFAAVLCLLLATVSLVTRPWAAALAVAVYVAGTEIRVRAEDGLLERRFGQRFAEYRRRVPAYVPFVR
jgi:protein-S-isoprenylcysteine O-methyltransferase Ste14